MRLAATVFAAALAAPAASQAQTPRPVCQNMIDRLAQLIPDLGATPNAAEKMNLTEEQLEAALAALDAARVVKETDPGGCVTMVNTARTLMARGQAAIPEGAQTITDLRGWSYQPLYDESWRASAVIDAPVRDEQGAEIGEVEDILMRPDGTLTAIIVEAGGFLDRASGGSSASVFPSGYLEEKVGENPMLPIERRRGSKRNRTTQHRCRLATYVVRAPDIFGRHQGRPHQRRAE